MPIEIRTNTALFKRAEQLKRWQESETNKVPATVPKDKNSKIKFSDGCVFLAACAASDTEEVERLLKLGTDINTTNVDGLTALHQACIDNNLEMVQFLVEHGCDVNRGDNEGWTPLHATASCGFLSIAKYLVEHGANVAAVNNDGDLPIDISESADVDEYLSDVLDEKGIDCDEARSEEENVMLADAKLVAERVLDIHERIHPITGATPLHVAAAKGYIEVMKILIKAGVDLNAQDNDGWTPLHAAAHWCQKEACALLADSLANMDIQNFAGQTCFDVADPDVTKLLEELKKKQNFMQKDRPEIQAILQRTSNRPPLKRRTSVTRMSGQEKSKSVMKDTKAERAKIENLSLPEEEVEEVNKTKTESSPDENNAAPTRKETEVSRVPSWKTFLRRASEENVDLDAAISEVILKRPKKQNENNKEDENQVKEGKPGISPVRDDESELQRKAHAKRVRETRRSTQGVLLEDIKSAELQYLINTQKEAAARQALEKESDSSVASSNKESSEKKLPLQEQTSDHLNTCDKSDSQNAVSKKGTEPTPSVTVVLKPKSSPTAEETNKQELENRTSLGTQAAIQRRRRPKRRSTGVVYLDSEDNILEKDQSSNSASTESNEKQETLPKKVIAETRKQHRYGSTQDSASVDTQYDSSGVCPVDDGKDYKKMFENLKREHENLKVTLKHTEEELEITKRQLLKNSANKNSSSDSERKERRALEIRISEMEEEVKLIDKYKADNERLKEENAALIRVISKISQ